MLQVGLIAGAILAVRLMRRRQERLRGLVSTEPDPSGAAIGDYHHAAPGPRAMSAEIKAPNGKHSAVGRVADRSADVLDAARARLLPAVENAAERLHAYAERQRTNHS